MGTVQRPYYQPNPTMADLRGRHRPGLGTAGYFYPSVGQMIAHRNYRDLTTRRPVGLGELGYLREQIDALDAEYLVTGKELNAQLAPCYPPPPSPVNDPASWVNKPAGCYKLFRFQMDVWSPLISSWEVYRKNNEDWWEAPWTSTDIKAYRERLKQFRERARAAGFLFAGPEPVTPPETDVIGGIGRIVKYGVVGGLILGGVFILYKVLPPGSPRR